MKNWLIRLLGGIPRPSGAKLHLLDSQGFVIISGFSDDIIKELGAVPLPKAGEGQYLRRPAACRMPVRKKQIVTDLPGACEGCKLVPCPGEVKCKIINPDIHFPLKDAIEAAGGEIHETTMQITMINLCDNCNARATDCHSATKETDGNNTLKCDQWKL